MILWRFILRSGVIVSFYAHRRLLHETRNCDSANIDSRDEFEWNAYPFILLIFSIVVIPIDSV